MIHKADPGLQAEMIDTNVTGSRGVDHILGPRDPHPTQRGLGDHTQEIDDHLVEGEYLHLTPQTGSPDQG